MKTIALLQAELKKLFEETVLGDQVLLKNTSGEAVTVKGFEQSLPIRKDDGEDTSEEAEDAGSFMPFFILRVNEGETEARRDPEEVSWSIIFGVYDNTPDNQGHKDILALIERAKSYIQSHPLLASCAYVPEENSRIRWKLQEEDTWPYFFGSLSFPTQVPSEGVEDEYI